MTIVTGLVAVTGTVAIWWAYFDAKEPASRDAVGASVDPTRYSVGTFNLLLGMVGAMILIAVGDELVIAHPLGHTDTRFAVLLSAARFSTWPCRSARPCGNAPLWSDPEPGSPAWRR